MRYIDNFFDVNETNNIIIYERERDINLNKLVLYFNVNKGSIPLSDFGNDLYSMVLDKKNDTLIKFMVNEIVNKITNDFNLEIDNCYYRLYDDKIEIIMEVEGKEIIFTNEINKEE